MRTPCLGAQLNRTVSSLLNPLLSSSRCGTETVRSVVREDTVLPSQRGVLSCGLGFSAEGWHSCPCPPSPNLASMGPLPRVSFSLSDCSSVPSICPLVLGSFIFSFLPSFLDDPVQILYFRYLFITKNSQPCILC